MPLVAFEPPCRFRAAGVAALDAAGVPWRLAFTSPSLSGLWAAVAAGLGVSMRTPAGLPGNVRVIGAEEPRLPALPGIALSLCAADAEAFASRRPTRVDPARHLGRNAPHVPGSGLTAWPAPGAVSVKGSFAGQVPGAAPTTTRSGFSRPGDGGPTQPTRCYLFRARASAAPAPTKKPPETLLRSRPRAASTPLARLAISAHAPSTSTARARKVMDSKTTWAPTWRSSATNCGKNAP